MISIGFFSTIIEVGGISLKLDLKGAPSSLADKTRKRYINFQSSGAKSAHEVHLEVNRKTAASEKLYVSREADKWNIKGMGIRANSTDTKTLGSIYPNIYIIDSFLRIILSRLIVQKGGIMMHASGRQGKVFTGPSSSGKTTAVEGKEDMLGDDILIIGAVEGEWYMFSTPFTGEYPSIVKNKKEKLVSITVLEEKKEYLGRGEMFRHILKNALYFMNDGGEMRKLAEYANDIANSVKGYGGYRKELV